MIRILAILNLVAALLVSSCLVFGLAMKIAPEQTARFLWHLSGADAEASEDYTIIGGDADGPTAVFISSRTQGCTIPMALLFVLLLGNAIVLWRCGGTRPAVQSDRSDWSDSCSPAPGSPPDSSRRRASGGGRRAERYCRSVRHHRAGAGPLAELVLGVPR